MNLPKLIITHRNPDLDAIVSAWLVRHSLFAGEPCEIHFVSALTDKLIKQADCIVDIGKVHNRAKLHFDHKGVECLRHITCSAKQVWRHLRKTGFDVERLCELVELVHDGDSAIRRPANSMRYYVSCRVGLHARLKELKSRRADDRAVFEAISNELDQQFKTEIGAMKRTKGRGHFTPYDYLERRAPYDYRERFARGSRILRQCRWKPALVKRNDPSVQIGSPVRCEAEKLAAKKRQRLETICDDVILAARIEHIVAVCGNAARVYFLGSVCPLTEKLIKPLSSYAPYRMRRVMQRLLHGSIDVEGNPLHWHDTFDFDDLISRFPRARGFLVKQAERWKAAEVLQVAAPSDIKELLVKLDWLPSAVRKLQALVDESDVSDKVDDSRVELTRADQEKEDKKKNRKNMMRINGDVSAACALIEKNIYDLPSRHFPPNLLPTRTQKERIADELSSILAAAESLSGSLRRLAP